MKCNAIQQTTNSTSSNSDHDVGVCTAWSVARYCSDMEWTELLSWKTDMSMNLQFKKVMKKSLQQNEGHLPLVPYCTQHRNKHPYASFPLPLIAHKLICHSIQIASTNTKPKHHYKIDT
jgi:hypothetical protein